MPAISQPHQTAPTFAPNFGVVSLSQNVRLRTLTLLNARKGNRTPIPATISSLCGDILPSVGKRKPFEHLYRIAFAFIDIGVSPEKVTQAFRELIEDVEHYASRRERRQSLGILPFRQRATTAAVTAQREDCEANCAFLLALETQTVESLDKAIVEFNEAIAADQATVALLTAEKIRREG